MRIRLVAFAVIVLMAGHAFAQATPRTPRTPAAPGTAAPPAPAAVAPPPPPPPAPPGPPRREGQPINVKVDLNITEEGGNAPAVKKSVSAVAGDGFNGYVREVASPSMPSPGVAPSPPVSLNFDAYPVILPSGKIRLTCTIQYVAGAGQPSAKSDGQFRTDIRQNLVMILESGKALVVSQATDPVSDRKVTVDVMATILK